MTTNFERKLKTHKEFEDDMAAHGLVMTDLLDTADALVGEVCPPLHLSLASLSVGHS